ncbi:hypothetical protein OIU76_018372 [Salix suchowensis]|nr:hypothetical protein OIU76_018372 [Salix suchowensis]
MKNTAYVVVLVWSFCWLLLLFDFTNSYSTASSSVFVSTISESTMNYNYDRIDEVKKHCAPFLASASDLKPEVDTVYNIKEDLYFVDGDWRQEVGQAPLLPYIDPGNQHSNFSDFKTPLDLASFWIMDVDRSHRLKKSVSVNGILVLGTTLDSLGYKPHDDSPHFQIWSESPTRAIHGNGLKANYNQPPLLQDDQILLVLRYPISFTLTNRVIQGEMKSLNSKSNLKYFDEVHILSQLGQSVKYEFGSERFVSKSCAPYPYNDSFVNGGIDIYKGTGFCEILGTITGEGAGPFTIVPNWRCNGTDAYCSKLGPFVSDKEIKATDGSFKGVKLFMKTIKLAMRSGLSNMTVVAEGIWKSSTGQLCMVGCLGLVDSDGKDLTLHSSAFPDPLPRSQPKRPADFQIEVLSLGPLFGRFWNVSYGDEETLYHNEAQYTEKQLLTNVSAQITLNGEAYSNFSVLFLEGLYDPPVGKMYLVGCRDVRASWNILLESMDLEAGLDCLIEAMVSYPPTKARWLVNPTARISISSQRSEDDPLYFSPVKLQTLPIMYRRQREDILSRSGVEGILRILTLSFAIACILSQLYYIQHGVDSVPFMSLVMLGVQALGYSLPLITGAEALFKRKSSESYESSSYYLEKDQWLNVIDYVVKLLVLAAFLGTLRLCQKVWKSRIRLLSRSPLEPHRVPSEKWIPVQMVEYLGSSGHSHTIREWETKLEEYLGLAQDFFLLPQSPVRNPYFAKEYEFVNPNMDFYSSFGDIAIPAAAIFLAVAVYIQQKWNYEKLSQALTIGQRRLLPLGSRAYERLPSKSIEAELASGVNENTKLETEHEDEE